MAGIYCKWCKLEDKNIMISIIIPVYNASPYLEKCVKSIQKQTIYDWELILVDDGSKDDSGEICDRLAAEDMRIRVVHQKNRGVSAARNAGLNMARGEYVMFVDSDDWTEPDLCETLLSYIKDSDVVICGYYFIYSQGNVKNVFSGDRVQGTVRTILYQYFDELYPKGLLNSPCSKLYKKSLLKKQMFHSDVALGEDLLFNLEYFAKCHTITVLPYAGYNYNCMNESSATKKFRESDVSQVIDLYQQVKVFQKTLGGDWSKSLAAERVLCLNEIGLMQLLLYSELGITRKRDLAKVVFASQAFRFSAEKCRNLPLKYEIPRRLCLWKSFLGLRVFYGLKKWVSQWMKNG